MLTYWLSMKSSLKWVDCRPDQTPPQSLGFAWRDFIGNFSLNWNEKMNDNWNPTFLIWYISWHSSKWWWVTEWRISDCWGRCGRCPPTGRGSGRTGGTPYCCPSSLLWRSSGRSWWWCTGRNPSRGASAIFDQMKQWMMKFHFLYNFQKIVLDWSAKSHWQRLSDRDQHFLKSDYLHKFFLYIIFRK